MAVPTGDKCVDVMAKLIDSIEDERKAGPDYQKLAGEVKEMFCGGTCPKGFLAQIGLQTLAIDENKHHDFLVQLLAAVEQECSPEAKEEARETIMAR
jgi:hypothetical protein